MAKVRRRYVRGARRRPALSRLRTPREVEAPRQERSRALRRPRSRRRRHRRGDSLAENVQRVALHPLDKFRAFATLREQGQCDEDIAARFFVPVQIVKQRLKLAAACPTLLDLYADVAMTLEQLMAFTVTGDHARQEQVWEALARSPYKEA